MNHQLVNQAQAWSILLFGAPNFFFPRMPPPVFWPPRTAAKASYYDNSPLRTTLDRLVDFDRINAGAMRFSVGAVDVCSGDFTYFDTTTHRIGAEHVMASGSLAAGLSGHRNRRQSIIGTAASSPTRRCNGCWSGRPRRDTLAFQVDLWNARGEIPKDLIEVEVRQKEIVYSSRNRAATEQYKKSQKLRIAGAKLIARLPPELRDSEEVKILEQAADDKVCNIVHLIYRTKAYEGIAKDFEFSRRTMEEHWLSGYRNARHTLANPEVLELPDRLEGVRTFDLGEDRRK